MTDRAPVGERGADLARIAQNYRVFLLRFISRQDETARLAGYDLGRDSVAAGVSLLELVRIHHDALSRAIADGAPGEAAELTTVAAEFFLEVTASYEMARGAGGLREPS